MDPHSGWSEFGPPSERLITHWQLATVVLQHVKQWKRHQIDWSAIAKRMNVSER